MTKRILEDEGKRDEDPPPPQKDKRPKPEESDEKEEQKDKEERKQDKESPPRHKHKYLSVVERRHPRIGSSYQVTALPTLKTNGSSTKTTKDK